MLFRRLCYFLYLRCMGFESMIAMRLRRFLVDGMLGRRHEDLFVFPHVFIEDWRGLTLGDHVSLNRGCNLSCIGGLSIGDNVAIGHGVSIITANHGTIVGAGPMKNQPVQSAAVTLGDDVWIGANATILAGVAIPEGTVVAAGAVVTRSVQGKRTVVGGAPARLLKAREVQA